VRGRNAPKNKKYHNRKWLYQKYVVEKLSMKKVAELCGCSATIIHKFLIVLEIPTRTIGDARKLPFGEASFNELFSNYKSKAKYRKIEFKLTKKQFRVLTSQRCHYCGQKPTQVYNRIFHRNNGNYLYNGIDRVNNNEGYIVSNCVPCCKHCNMAKNKFTVEEFKDWIKQSYNYMELKSWR